MRTTEPPTGTRPVARGVVRQGASPVARATAVAALLAPFLLLSACAEGRGDVEWSGTVDTLAGGAVHVRNPAEPIWRADEAWRLEEELRIGSATEEGPALFGQVADVLVDPLGRIYVLESQSNEIRVFDGSGRHVRTFAREGQGPGELNQPSAMAWDGEGMLWVVDPRNARFSAFDTAGEYREERTKKTPGQIYPWPGRIGEDGDVIDVAFARVDDEFRRTLIRYDSLNQPVDTFFPPAYDAPQFEIRTETAFMASSVPFAERLVWRLHPDGTLWFSITDAYRLYEQTLDGDTLRIVEKPFEPLPVGSEELDEAIERLDWFTEQGGRLDRSRIPDRKPALEGFFFDDRDNVWVRPVTEEALEDRVFDVFDPEGRWLGRVESPVALSSSPAPRFHGDVVYGVTRDELDVPYVVRLRIVRPSAEDG